jgi:hypothetical protein
MNKTGITKFSRNEINSLACERKLHRLACGAVS